MTKLRTTLLAGWITCPIRGLLIAGLLIALSASPSLSGEPIRVATSILPLADFTRQVGGDRVEVILLIPPGQNPHTIQFRPAQLKALSKSRLLILNGLGLEFWSDKVIRAMGRPELQVLKCGEGQFDPNRMETHHEPNDPGHDRMRERHHGKSASPSHETEAGKPHDREDSMGHGHGHGGSGIDPHLWLDPLMAKKMVTCIRDGLIRLDPDSRKVFEHNEQSYQKKLDRLHQDYREGLAKVRTRTLITLHGGYGHLARRYNLEVLSLVDGGSEMEPAPVRMRQIIDLIRKEKIRIIMSEPQFSANTARAIQAETGVRLGSLDALGTSEKTGYLDLMRKNLSQLRLALLE